MRADKKILIHTVLTHLQRRDPAWEHVKMIPKFKTVYGGWADTCVRHHKHSREYFSRKWRDGWLPFEEWMDFYGYAMQ